MKIKKINIHAFRLFKDESVDFTAKRDANSLANLVAIYAPNGFGKTSFFDSMEFCITGKIHRLDKAVISDDVKEDKKQAGNKSFIHNKDFPGEKVALKMEFDDREPVERICCSDEEYKILEGNGENTFFSNAILSQDFFSEFISNKNAKDRFEIFTRNFKETEGLLEYRRWLKEKRTSLSKQIGSLSSQIKSKQSLIDKKVSEIDLDSLFETVNKDLFAIDCEDLKVNGYSSEKQLQDILCKAEVNKEKSCTRIDNVKTLLSAHLKLKNSVDGVLGLYQLPQIEEKLKQLNKDKVEIDKELSLVNRYEELQHLLESAQKLRADTKQESEKLHYLVDTFEEYNRLILSITEKESEISKFKVSIDSILEQKKIFLSSLLREQENLAKEECQDKTLSESLVVLHSRYERMTLLNQRYDDNTKNLTLAISNKEDLEKKLTNLRILSGKYHELYATLTERKVDFSEGLFIEEKQRLLDLQAQIKSKQHDIDSVNSDIEKKSQYQDEIEKLVISSREMLSKIGGSVCPLCGYDYHLHEALLDSISSNTIIDKSLDDDARKRDALIKDVDLLISKKEQLFTTIIASVDDQIQKNKQDEIGKEQDIEKVKLHISELFNILDALQKELEDKYSDLKDITEENKRIKLEQAKASNLEALEATRKAIDSFINKISSCEKQTSDVNEKISQYLRAIANVKSTSHYIKYVELAGKSDVTTADIERWQEQDQEKSNAISQYTVSIDAYKKELADLKSRNISLQNVDILSLKLKELTDSIYAFQKDKTDVFNYLEQECRIENLTRETTGDDVIALFECSLSNSKALLEKEENKLHVFENLVNTIHVLNKFHVNQALKDEIQDLQTKMEKDVSLKDMCNGEISSIQTYLENFVNSYFELDLINRLYNTIDPHPDYKKIRFVCDFTLKDPRLKILVSNVDEGKENIVPNLYFSTAQMNILSFCIFLAKALFAKDDHGRDMNCIFIDDPIQALDDINILSIIDLLRNVAFSMNKQIVLTTHDRNFFELLQKKAPDTLFNSKFITLPERGKFAYV